MFIANNLWDSGVCLPIYIDTLEDVTEETPPAEETDKPSKAAKRKRPAEKRATKKKKSEQVSEHYPLSAINGSQHFSLFVCHGYMFLI